MIRLTLIGASGLTGKAVLALLLANPQVEQVIAPTRKALPEHAKLLQISFDEYLHQEPKQANSSHVICCFGTTLKQAGSKANFVKIERDLCLQLCARALHFGAKKLSYVSSMGTSHKALSLYSRTKAEIETSLSQLELEQLVIIRPSLLSGSRSADKRPLEYIAIKLSSMLKFIIPASMRPTEIENLAKALVNATLSSDQSNLLVQGSDQINRFARN
ncbi:hypothetical protein DBZ36_05090 [Alginatibacterium sediminis]|uniref:NAD-dependent epimerase/dehydratase domain-containing protein n=1 Tax=Alginatibacterium sediminis TaxID=2164068 RepID=A0A420EGP0_9ALTE|nr:NAD-dependent epimerase/dehydratase family protein [Alginatibacterium sediminis]RKF19837.1 hypothetical protein DBZ36_05090 [Alginatibacterium sediminis]